MGDSLCPDNTNHRCLSPDFPLTPRKARPSSASEPSPTTPDATRSQKSNSPLFELLKPPESESWKPVEKSSLWTNSLNKLHSDKTPCCSKDHETPEKLLNTEALQALQNPTPSHTSDPVAGNSNEHEVDELPEVTKNKLVFFWFIGKMFISVQNLFLT